MLAGPFCNPISNANEPDVAFAAPTSGVYLRSLAVPVDSTLDSTVDQLVFHEAVHEPTNLTAPNVDEQPTISNKRPRISGINNPGGKDTQKGCHRCGHAGKGHHSFMIIDSKRERVCTHTPLDGYPR